MCLSFSFRRFMFWCIVRFSSFDFVFLFILCLYVFVCCCFAFSSLYRSLNILFVCFVLLITGCFCLRSRDYSPQQKCVIFLWVVFCCCGWCLFLWPLLMRSLPVFLLCVCVGMGVVYSFSLSFKYLDQRVGFFHCFLMIFFLFALLRVQEFKSFFLFVLIFPPLFFLSLSMLLFVLIYLAVYFH